MPWVSQGQRRSHKCEQTEKEHRAGISGGTSEVPTLYGECVGLMDEWESCSA